MPSRLLGAQQHKRILSLSPALWSQSPAWLSHLCTIHHWDTCTRYKSLDAMSECWVCVLASCQPIRPQQCFLRTLSSITLQPEASQKAKCITTERPEPASRFEFELQFKSGCWHAHGHVGCQWPIGEFLPFPGSKLLRAVLLNLCICPAVEDAGLDLVQHLPPQLGKRQPFCGADGALQRACPDDDRHCFSNISLSRTRWKISSWFYKRHNDWHLFCVNQIKTRSWIHIVSSYTGMVRARIHDPDQTYRNTFPFSEILAYLKGWALKEALHRKVGRLQCTDRHTGWTWKSFLERLAGQRLSLSMYLNWSLTVGVRSIITSGSIFAYSCPAAESGGSPPSCPCLLYSLSPWRVSQILRGLPLALHTCHQSFSSSYSYCSPSKSRG